MSAIGAFKIIGSSAGGRLLLLLGIFLSSGVVLYAQLKEVELEVMKEAEAIRLKNEGGIYVNYSEVPARKGRWVQYRKVLRVDQGANNPNTGERWYNVYFSQVIPLEYQDGHDPAMIKDGWLWLPNDAPAPWKLQAASPAFVWTLQEGYPIWNPNNQPLEHWLPNNREVINTSIYSDGVTQHLYGFTASGALDYDWFFVLRWSQLPPHQLTPGQSFTIDLSAEAGGRLQVHPMSLSAQIAFKGFDVQYDPSDGPSNQSIIVGRPEPGSQLILRDQRRFIFTVPQQSTQKIHLAVMLDNWGGIVTYMWEKQPVY